ncbi:hypothetical protein FIBSPDRAFT_860264 [Athelia psychrophila]|uniref:Uncharacterized protein n=1 Tax=Athelia psychrophila TaxID=1759441 RepID=A0A166KGV3_9AGAM|nr:hypothetical protein FIBSPDRAFT_860264 [Fibularhizoctonia sp. CBS 109695]
MCDAQPDGRRRATTGRAAAVETGLEEAEKGFHLKLRYLGHSSTELRVVPVDDLTTQNGLLYSRTI